MIFTAFNFLIFFPIVIIIYYLLPEKFRWKFLLAASFFFYINIKPVYAVLLAIVIAITYIFPILIENAKSFKRKKLLLVINIVLTLLPLFFFKYFNFINESVFDLLKYIGIRWPLPEISFMLPIGISFYTFMALGYSIDVYNEEIPAEKNLGIVALFLSFFPLVLSGPIERAPNMLPQFKSKLLFNYNKVVEGLQWMLWGYFMKLVVADRIAIYVNAIFNNIDHHNGRSLLVGTLLYPIQVYADLGGYSLIAIGCAKVMGIDVMQNFNRPFFATSMSEFWRRWHISLISWLTDYIYTPLAFNLRRYKIWGIVMALMLTFFLSGIWHGATLTFIIWGTMQGIFLSIEALTNKRKKNLVKKYRLAEKGWYLFICSLFTYFLFAFSEIFGGAVESVSQAFLVIKKIFTDFHGNIWFENPSMVLISSVSIFILFFVEFKLEYYRGPYSFFNNRRWIVRFLSYSSLIIIILLIGVFDGGQFIYFQF
jgi:D-alanyl-lipoteichoic acid acyltransferase DltB (MBOAT superfamily)